MITDKPKEVGLDEAADLAELRPPDRSHRTAGRFASTDAVDTFEYALVRPDVRRVAERIGHHGEVMDATAKHQGASHGVDAGS